jgi:hypothetical protein
MWFFYSLFICLIISINGLEKKIYEQKLSSVDAEIISFASSSLMKYFRNEEQVRSTHIIRIKTAVSLILYINLTSK